MTGTPGSVRREAVQGLWLGSRLSMMERLSIASFLANGHDYHLYVYDDVSDVPRGVRLQDARDILPPDWKFRDDRGTWGAFSDCFRFKLLLDKGGWWVDADMVCLRPFDFEDECVFLTEPDLTVGTAVIRTPPASEAMARAWDTCRQVDRLHVPWATVGPKLLISVVQALGLTGRAVDSRVFCPFDWSEWQQALDPGIVWQFTPATRAVHLWNSMWALAGKDKDAVYPPGCLYETLKQRYLGMAATD